MLMKRFFKLILPLAFLCGCGLQTLPDESMEERDAHHQEVTEATVVTDMRKELGREFLMAARNEFLFVKDPEVLSLVNSMGREIVEAAGGDPDYYHFFVIRKNEINAFAVPGGYIFLYDGLLKSMGSMDALAGVLAHEIAHVERDHHFKDSGKMALADLATLAGMILTGVAGDRPDASIAIGQGANIAYKLKLSRAHEEDADLLALRYLRQTDYHPEGLLDFFKKLSSHNRLNSGDMIPSYLSTHPGVIGRQVIVEALIKDLPAREDSTGSNRNDWDRVVTILKGEGGDAFHAFRAYGGGEAEPFGEEKAHYLKGLYTYKSDDYRHAVIEYEAALRLNPKNPVYHADLAMMYLSLQHLEKAAAEAKESIRLSKEHAAPFVVLALLAQNAERQEEALEYFREAERLNPLNVFVHYHMAGTLHALGMTDRGRYHLAQYFRLNLKAEDALRQLEMALEETEDEAFIEEVKKAIRTLKRDGV